jgi:hypothetical protein
MTPRDFAFAALDYLPTPATITGASASQLRRIASDLTAACQVVWSIAPQLYKDTRSANLLAPQTGTLVATGGSVTFSGATVTMIPGSTILIDGDSNYNEVATTTTLARAYAGTSATVSFQMWNDALVLASEIHAVIRPVRFNATKLTSRANRDDFQRRPTRNADYGRQIRRPIVNTPIVGTPTDYWVEARMRTTSTLILRITPMPRAAGALTYDVRVNAPTIAVADLGTDSVDSTVVIYIESQYHESILRPIFLKKWSASPWFRDEEAAKKIDLEDKEARALLASFRPQQENARRMIAPQ